MPIYALHHHCASWRRTATHLRGTLREDEQIHALAVDSALHLGIERMHQHEASHYSRVADDAFDNLEPINIMEGASVLKLYAVNEGDAYNRWLCLPTVQKLGP